MTTAAWLLLGFTLVVAAVDWWAVHEGREAVEHACKPATMVALFATAVALDPVDGGARTWVLVALVCSLAGDVFLMLPRDAFVMGLVSFLLGHLAYVAGLVPLHDSWALTGVGLILVSTAIGLIAPPILRAVRAREPALAVPVVVYMLVISTMVVTAWGTAAVAAIVGACLFYASDATLAWNRFVREQRHGPVAVMVTYHLGQVGLVLALVR